MKNDIFCLDIKNNFKHLLYAGLIMNITFSDKKCTPEGFNPRYLSMINDYEEDIERIIQNREYICQMKDGSPIQIAYCLSSKMVCKASFIYIPILGIDSDKIEEKKELFYIRYDYDFNSSEDSIIHCKSHLHIGIKSPVRLPVYPVLLPSEFIRLIAFLFYPDEYKSYFNGRPIVYDITDENINLKIHSSEVIENLCLHVKK